MKGDAEIALERVQSESLGALMSIQSYREIEAAYFDRLRTAVRDAADHFSGDNVPSALLTELRRAANVIRNEATVFPGRTHACLEMADWLETSASQIEAGGATAA